MFVWPTVNIIFVLSFIIFHIAEKEMFFKNLKMINFMFGKFGNINTSCFVGFCCQTSCLSRILTFNMTFLFGKHHIVIFSIYNFKEFFPKTCHINLEISNRGQGNLRSNVTWIQHQKSTNDLGGKALNVLFFKSHVCILSYAIFTNEILLTFTLRFFPGYNEVLVLIVFF